MENSDVQSSSSTTPLSTGETYSPVPLRFHGNASEFFGIWIVNVLLTIVTLGIYSAWAKVRTTQYFHGNTELDNHRFSYLAQPLDILKGRIAAVILFGGYSLVSSFFPVAGLVFLLILMLLSPFLICSSMRFNLRMTSYRNVRFNFTGQYGEAFMCFFLLPILSIFTLWLLLPYVFSRMDRFLMSNIQYGGRQFNVKIGAQKYYVAMLVLMCLSSAVMMAFGVIAALGGLSAETLINAEDGTFNFEHVSTAVLILAGLLYFFVINAMSAYYKATIRNYILENTTIEGVASFKSNYKFVSYTVLLFTNFLAIMCSFGLALPWVKVRMTNYAITHTDVALTDNKDNIVDILGEQSTALGEEVANVFDVDVALI